MSIQEITIIGSGNVAYHLGKRLRERALIVREIFSRKMENAQALANLINAKAITQLADLEKDSDLYIIAVSDDAIEEIVVKLSKILPPKALIVHTSGVTPSTIFRDHFQHYGIFYPLQSFSKSKSADFNQIPICIDANDQLTLNKLRKLAKKISPKIYEINDEQRAYLHLAAVYANNFTNYLFSVAAQILEQQEIPFELLQPLILETAQKVQTNPPKLMQTGPAIRGDEASIKRHLDLLNKHREWRRIYELLSQRIQEEML